MKIGKITLKPWLILIPILLYLGWEAIAILHLEGSSIRNKRNIGKVEIGMAKADVIEIMGKPRSTHLSFINQVDSVYFYLPPIGSSEGIYIQFDSIGFVNEIEK
jgi:outer membrane protein assembly factor BamE (lipoprotein component of BamABCDE complex)